MPDWSASLILNNWLKIELAKLGRHDRLRVGLRLEVSSALDRCRLVDALLFSVGIDLRGRRNESERNAVTPHRVQRDQVGSTRGMTHAGGVKGLSKLHLTTGYLQPHKNQPHCRNLRCCGGILFIRSSADIEVTAAKILASCPLLLRR
jgi:hypothetical protein